MFPVQFFAGLLLFLLFKSKLAPSTYTALSFYHRLFGRLIFLGFLSACIVSGRLSIIPRCIT